MSVLSPSGMETVDLGGSNWRVIYNQNITDLNDDLLQFILNCNTTANGNNGAGETTMLSYSLPASTLSTNAESISIKAWGTTASNSNVKTIKLKFGSTILVTDSGSFVGDSWLFEATIVRTGATSQDAIAEAKVNGIAPVITHTEPAETLANPITIAITGQGTSDDDIVAEGLRVEFNN